MNNSVTNPDNLRDERNALIAELEAAGIKHTPEKIVRIAKRSDGKIVFLESGDEKRGLQHILGKADQFANIGINLAEIADAIMIALTEGTIVGYQGTVNLNPRPIYQFTFQGDIKYISITVSSNGYIVGANPRARIE